ncbi:AEC family transporter [Kandleria sp.]|uniref:AEC family transporter n=1 Tax=Kandleria sp. TaxID=2774291 RepID=UPI001B490BB8|nr:AEC family transporter [Kandleria sp.]MBP3276317.1 AEC family transporter [Kandleria sp.]
MSELAFSLNATMPVFLLMVLGYCLHKTNWIDDDFAAKLNRFVFRLPLPMLLFNQLSSTDFYSSWDPIFISFCFLATLLSIGICVVISTRLDSFHARGEFIQASYRSSAALLGIAYIQNVYNNAHMAPLMILGAVPLYNVMAVVVLSATNPLYEKHTQSLFKDSLKGIARNPIIIGIAAGFIWSLLKIPQPTIMVKTLKHIGNLSTPLGLMAMGATIDPTKVKGQLKNSIIASFIKLIGLECLFLPFAIMWGFRNEQLLAICIMLGSATTVSSYVMAKNMNHEGTLSSNTVVLTTLLSAFTLTFWIFILRYFALI